MPSLLPCLCSCLVFAHAFAFVLAFLSVIPEGNLLFVRTTQKMGAPCLAFETWEGIPLTAPPPAFALAFALAFAFAFLVVILTLS
jgi:hypothetical protein